MDEARPLAKLKSGKSGKSSEEVLNFLRILPYEIWWIILNFCRPDDWFMMAKTCWRARDVVTSFVRSAIKTKNIPDFKDKSGKKPIKGLYSEQIKGLVALRNNPDSNIFLRSPMGTGKTLLAILHAFDCWKERGIRTIIVATPKCFTSWLEHLKLVGLRLVKSRPEKSDMLVIHSTTKKHQEFFFNGDLKKSPYFIILTTRAYIEPRKAAFSRRFLNLTDVFQQIIVDEAHLLSSRVIGEFFDLFPRCVFLSADEFPGTIAEYNSRTREYEKRAIYDISMNLECEIDHPVAMDCRLLPLEGGEVRSVVRLLNSPKFKGRKVVLFTQWNTDNMRIGLKYLRDNVSEYTFVKFVNTNLASKEKFKKIDKCVLVTTLHTATEGTNFEIADSAIYTNFAGGIRIKKARQCFARVRRRNNPNPVIYNYIFYDTRSDLSLVRSKINITSALDTDLDLDNKSNHQINLIAKVMRKDGIDVNKLPKPELITIFTHNLTGEPLPFVEEDYTLTLMNIIRYMSVGG